VVATDFRLVAQHSAPRPRVSLARPRRIISGHRSGDIFTSLLDGKFRRGTPPIDIVALKMFANDLNRARLAAYRPSHREAVSNSMVAAETMTGIENTE